MRPSELNFLLPGRGKAGAKQTFPPELIHSYYSLSPSLPRPGEDIAGRAIRELFDRGFIDLEKQGSGMHKDFSLYRFSERWKKYAEADFKHKKFSKRPVFGCFGEPNRRQKQRHKTAVEQRPISAVFLDTTSL
jgi:hypothetical protein